MLGDGREREHARDRRPGAVRGAAAAHDRAGLPASRSRAAAACTRPATRTASRRRSASSTCTSSARARHRRLWDALGARPMTVDGVAGVAFAVWAPAARGVAVVGDFNGWDERRHPMRSHGRDRRLGAVRARRAGRRPVQARIHGADGSVSCAPIRSRARRRCRRRRRRSSARARHVWADDDWMATRGDRHRVDRADRRSTRCTSARGAPGSTTASLAETLPAYVAGLGFTHVELMPVMAHPFGGSWGYQVTGYYAVDSRLGTPDDLRFLIDRLHAAGIGVILDWVPGALPARRVRARPVRRHGALRARRPAARARIPTGAR